MFIAARKIGDKERKITHTIDIDMNKNACCTQITLNTLNTKDTKQSSILLPFSVKRHADCSSLKSVLSFVDNNTN